MIVTTPQDIALLDAKKAIEMFRKVSIPILGIVENMSEHVSEKCGHKSYPLVRGRLAIARRVIGSSFGFPSSGLVYSRERR